MSVLVLGLGNLVHTDDGVGVHAIRQLQLDSRIPADVTLIDGGTQGLSLLPHISGYSRVLVIDAIHAGERPGTVVVYKGSALEGLPGKASVHQLGFADLMVAMRLLDDIPDEMVVVGMQPLSTEWNASLTPVVQDALPGLLDVVIEQLEIWKKTPLPQKEPRAEGAAVLTA